MRMLFLLYDINISFELLLIIALFGYIIYLQLKIIRKNSLLKSCFAKIEITDSKLNKKDIIRFLENIKNPDYTRVVTKDKILDKKIHNFIFENETEIKLFLHYTTYENIAKKILTEGFKFVNSFYKTAEHIYNDELYLIQRHHEHKQFGDYVIVICISKNIFSHYSEELNNIKSKNIAVEQILTEIQPTTDENNELLYTLPKQFVKGYFNYKEGGIMRNPDFNPYYHSDVFDENLKNILEE
ncbi:MAG: hypothetical protein KAQ75_01550 [Bacteroidales bacterium]|nr:hypothetical protein [Bacteroidales bacterium]